ncbi:MAG: CoA transferase [Deltaproteobacteria bacterium]|nr:CoA transferase [Deltaproteobacteria bacterium]
MATALAGVRILDLSRLLPGPFCTMLLADFGADVVKVEEPRIGDYIRAWQPRIGNNSGFHVVLNRNKRSLTLNLKSMAAQEIFRQLARQADVVLEGFRPGVMARLGLDYQSLRSLNSRLIYCSLSGYGENGPRARRAGHDINYLALSGILSYSGREGRPTVPGVQIADLGGGALLTAFSIALALFARERRGEGQYLDISMLDGSFMWNCLRWGQFQADGMVPRLEDDLLNHGFACYNLYETSDCRFMSLGAIEPQFWRAFCHAVAKPEWDQSNYIEPGPHQEPLKQAVAALFKQRTQAEWVAHFEKHDCCVEPVLNLEEASNDPQIQARQMVVDLMHESWGAYRQLGIAPKFSRTPGTLRSAAPELGEHTEAILQELGYQPEQVRELRQQGVV